MNLALFFEGTGQGVAGAFTNVTRLRDLCLQDKAQLLHLEAGPGTHFGTYATGAIHGVGWRQIFNRAKSWFQSKIRTLQPTGDEEVKIYLFGFSRGALIARHFAAWLEPQGFPVAYLGLWDTVDSTINLDVSETCPSNVRAARHAIARDETRRFYTLVPLRPNPNAQPQKLPNSPNLQTPKLPNTPNPQTSKLAKPPNPQTSKLPNTPNLQTSPTCTQLVFPGSHSDVGGLYADNHLIADAALDWIAQGAVKAGLRLKAKSKTRRHRDYSLALLHSEQDDSSNLWGVFRPVRRSLRGLRRHLSCHLKIKST